MWLLVWSSPSSYELGPIVNLLVSYWFSQRFIGSAFKFDMRSQKFNTEVYIRLGEHHQVLNQGPIQDLTQVHSGIADFGVGQPQVWVDIGSEE